MTSQTGTFEVRRLGDEVVEVVFIGRMAPAEIKGSLDRAVVLLRERPATIYLIDTIGVDAIEPSIRTPASEAMKRLQALGVRELVVAVQLTAVRMLGAAIAFGAGVPIKFFATRDEALRYARAPRPERPSARV